MSRQITFRSYMWFVEETDEGNEMSIYIGGLDLQCRSVSVRVIDYHPHVYLEITQRTPRGENWSEQIVRSLFTYFQRTFRPPPLSYKPVVMKSIYSLKPAKLLRLTFPSYSSSRKFASACTKRGFTIEGVGTFKIAELTVHEHNIDPIIKFTSEMNLNLTGWLSVQEYIPEDEIEFTDEERRFSTSTVNMVCRIEDIKSVNVDMSISTTIRPKYMSFDIECYSENHNSKLPDPTLIGNPVFHISAIVGRFGQSKEERKRYLLTLFNPHDIEGCTVIRYRSEEELILGFTQLIQDENPDVFLGYNILKFDFNYLIERAKILGILDEFLIIGRIIDRVCQPISVNWSSSAYGKQVFQMPNVDRTQMDLLVEVERNFKLSDYRLDTVAKEFLGQEKLDVSPKQLFKLYNLTQESTKILSKPVTKEAFLDLRSRISEEILPIRQCQGVVRELRKDLLECKTLTKFRGVVDKAMYLTGKYCVHDSELVIDIAEKLNTLTSMEELAGVTHVPMTYLQTRGQQIKVLAQVYRLSLRENIFISSLVPTKEKKFAGATVVSVRSGRFDNVITLDFASLYPSIIIARNICYTTLERDESREKDCIVVKFGEHRACEHDTTVRKTKIKESERLCEEHKYMFNRPIYSPDGSSIGQGLLPRLVKSLMSERKRVKREMEMYEAKIAMATGKMPEREIEEWKGKGVTVKEEDNRLISEWKMIQKVLDARQIALKLVCNSVVGNSPIPCIINDQFVYRTIEELSKGDWTEDKDGNQIATPIDNLLVWSDIGFTSVNYIFRHKREKSKLLRINTHIGIVDCTDGHSLLLEDGTNILGKDVKIGDHLMHRSVPLPLDTPKEPIFRKISRETIMEFQLTEETEMAFVWGLFFAEGSAGVWSHKVHKRKSSWIIYNQDYALLERARDILSRHCDDDDLSFYIYGPYECTDKNLIKGKKHWKREDDFSEHGFIFHLRPKGNVKHIAMKYRSMFYDNRRHKRIPDIILTSPLKIRQAFFMGYYAGDGSRYLDIGVVVSNKGAIGTAGLMFLAKSIGYKVSVSQSTPNQDSDNFRLQCSTKFKITDTTAVKLIINTPIISSYNEIDDENNEYVYDIETASHHFAAGVGNIIVHNSTYGTLGVSKGYLPLPEGAASVTATGRQLIEGASQFIEKVFADKGAKLVYGDSVTGDTPILCRLGEKIFYRTIDNLPYKRWIKIGNKEQAQPVDGLEVWSDEGFTPIDMIIRHSTRKRVFRVVTDTGVVHVTEDHSLLSSDGSIIKPTDVIPFSTQLLSKTLPKVYGNKITLCSYTMGLFYGGGRNDDLYWIIDNIDINTLIRARTELESIYPNTISILTDMNSCGMNSLRIRKNNFINLYLTDLLEHIFECNIDCQSRFLEGLSDSDGDIKQTSLLDYAKLYLITNNIIVNSEPMLYITSFNTIKISFRKSDNRSTVRSIEPLGECTDQYVYDLETKNHHFAAGVGQIIVHNTDSTFIQFSKELSIQEVYALGPIISRETSHYLRCKLIGLDENQTVNINNIPIRFDKIKETDLSEISNADRCRWYEYQATPMNLEFEKMFGSLIMLTKKRYIGEIVNSDGKIIKTLKKGVMVVRRDNCKWARDVYTSVMDSILADRSKDEIMGIITDSIIDLYSMKIKDVDLIIVVGIKDVREYADKKIQKEPSSDINPFIDSDGKAIRDVKDPLDSRLVYKNKLQAKLCLKMLRRGDTVPPNTRLEYVLLDIGHDKSITTGDRVEDYTYYRENKEELKLVLDRAEYVRKISTSINEILNVASPPKVQLFEKVEERFLRLCSEVKNEIIKQRLNSKRKTNDKLKFVFDSMRDNTVIHNVIQTVKRSDGSIYKRTIMKREPRQNMIHLSKHSELIDASQNLNSRLVLTKLFKSYKLRMPSERRPKDGSIILDDDPIGSIYKSRLEWSNVLNDIKNGPR